MSGNNLIMGKYFLENEIWENILAEIFFWENIFYHLTIMKIIMKINEKILNLEKKFLFCNGKVNFQNFRKISQGIFLLWKLFYFFGTKQMKKNIFIRISDIKCVGLSFGKITIAGKKIPLIKQSIDRKRKPFWVFLIGNWKQHNFPAKWSCVFLTVGSKYQIQSCTSADFLKYKPCYI